MREDLSITQSVASNLTVRHALQEGAAFLSRSGIDSARLDAEILLAMALGRRREELYVNFERLLGSRESSLFRSALERRALGEPVAYITGRREFWSHDFVVTPDVLIPRPETELVVEAAIGLIEDESHNSDLKFQILDLGTGSGNIAASLAKERSEVAVWATDISRTAIEVAGTNAARLGVEERIRFLQGDLFEPVADKRDYFHMIVSNPPYVRRDEIPALPRDVRNWEPIAALDGGIDGLDFYRRIAAEGQPYLKPQGFIVVEIGGGMAAKILDLLAALGCYSSGTVRRDYSGRERVVVAQKRA